MTFLTDFVALELVLNQSLCLLKVSGLFVAGLGSHCRRLLPLLPCRSLPFWLRSCLRGEEESRFGPRYRSPRGTCRVRRSFSEECEIERKGKKLENGVKICSNLRSVMRRHFVQYILFFTLFLQKSSIVLMYFCHD